MSIDTSISPDQEARAFVLARLVGLRTVARREAVELANSYSNLSASQIRGLTNAVGPGPGRRTPADRRRELARFLAWQTHRATGEGVSWMEGLRQAIVSLEQRCADVVDKERRSQATRWQTHAAALKTAEEWLTMEVLEIFLHALERELIAGQED